MYSRFVPRLTVEHLEFIFREEIRRNHEEMTGRRRRLYLAADIAIWCGIVALVCFAVYLEMRF